MSSYCEISDVYDWVRSDNLPNPPKIVSSIDADTEIISLPSHGWATDTPVTLRAEAGGSLPSPIVEGTTYYVIALTSSTLSLAAAAGGAAINLTTDGSNVLMLGELPWASWIEKASSEVEGVLIAHAMPIEADDAGEYHPTVVEYTAGLVAERAMGHTGVSSALIDRRLDRIFKRMDSYLKLGAPLRGENVPPRANVAIRGGASSADPRGWCSRGSDMLP